jgi:DNA polymerase
VTTRDEILAELGISPRWLHRDRLADAANAAEHVPAPQQATEHGRARQKAAEGQSFESPAVTPYQEREDDTVSRKTSLDKAGNSIPVQEMDWPQLRQAVAQCRRCVLHQRRKQAVFGVGDERADWLIVGEGPGAEEDARGEPFVGQAGKLLDNMLAAIGLARGHNVYIANVVKCRPPGNRTPTAQEAEACAAYLDRQIDLIQPRLIVALGKVAAHRLLGRDATLGSLRKTVHEYRGIPLVVTYHPAYLLRNMTDKSKSWEDLCFAVDTMSGLPGDKAQSS